MNYSAHYQRLISRTWGRVLEGYRERHHVVPRCMGGNDAPHNLVELTAEEHYVAHQLLCKLHPEVAGLVIAAVRMARQCTGNKAYGWLKRRRTQAQLGQHHSWERRAKISATLRGRKQPPRSPEYRANIAAAHRGMKASPETRAKLSASHIGIKMPVRSAEHRARLSAALRARVNRATPVTLPERGII